MFILNIKNKSVVFLFYSVKKKHVSKAVNGESENHNQNSGNLCGLYFICMGHRETVRYSIMNLIIAHCWLKFDIGSIIKP